MKKSGLVGRVLLCMSFSALILAGCRGPEEDAIISNTSPPPPPGGGNVVPKPGSDGPLDVTLASNPSIQYNPTNGKTSIIVQFMVREQSGRPLSDGSYTTTMLVDNEPLDVESLLDRSSQELAVNLNFAMVLDASYSMLEHNPPAFEPMKQAARDTHQSVLDTWKQRSGKVNFNLIWFAEVVNQSIRVPGVNREWVPDDILTLPAPQAGTATRLYGATRRMTDTMISDFKGGIAAGPRDHHVMVVFSDGKDNYSYFDNSALSQTLTTNSGASYRQSGTTPTTLDDVKSAIAAHPQLSVHVIGLGSSINDVELQAIADAGRGVFLKNPDSSRLDQLFDDVLAEFITLRTEGALIPMPPGDYTFTLRVTNSAATASDEYTFRFHGGDATARELPVP